MQSISRTLHLLFASGGGERKLGGGLEGGGGFGGCGGRGGLFRSTPNEAGSPWQWCPCGLASLWTAAQPQSLGPALFLPPLPALPAWPEAFQETASAAAAGGVGLLMVGLLCGAKVGVADSAAQAAEAMACPM